MVVQEGDIVLTQGNPKLESLEYHGLKIVNENPGIMGVLKRETSIAEITLAPHSKVVGKTLKEIHFREKYKLTIKYIITNNSGYGLATARNMAAIEAEGDEATGVNIVLRAIEEPVRQIAQNAGLEGSVIVERLKHEKPGVGFNAATGEWVNMVEAGIVDPTKVTRSALQNAGSVAAMFLTTEAVVADKPEPAGAGGGMPDMGGMGGMGGMM